VVAVDKAEAAVHRLISDASGIPVEREGSEALDYWYRIYCRAGRSALDEYLARPFTSLRVVLRSEDCSDEVLACVGAVLSATGRQWWFMRKGDEEGPHLRLRVRRSGPEDVALLARLEDVLRELQRRAMVSRWNSMVYEPETALFGGGEGMTASHAFFCEDSRAIGGLPGREGGPTKSFPANRQLHPALSLLVLASGFQGARLDPFETWDVWRRVHGLRPYPHTAAWDAAVARTRFLLKAAGTDAVNDGGVLEWGGNLPQNWLEMWRTAARELGNDLRVLANSGRLERGLRDVLSVHVLFHWNRMGFGPGVQSCIAGAAASDLSPE
jgi:thiopeptide-type bacteriocin biosynthesis protein